ncbi:GNAT family N-acetyltransferase [bacterium]|nr:GNAT family N-acetyltransferase [bacterium]
MNVIIRELTEAEDVQANDLLNLAFESHTNRLNDFRLYRRLQPDGWFKACLDGRMVGTVGAICYRDFAHVGFMTVHPDLQGQGIGRMLMEHILAWLDGQNVPLVTLDASRKGFPLYEKLGFRTLDETAIFERQIEGIESMLPGGVQFVTSNDITELVAMDKPVYGADRGRVFNTMLELHPSRAFLHRDGSGRITGYLFAHRNRIGPWVMFEHGQEHALLAAAITLEYENPVSVCVPSVNHVAVELLESFGFIRARAGKHMSKGSIEVRGERIKVFAQTSLGAG